MEILARAREREKEGEKERERERKGRKEKMVSFFSFFFEVVVDEKNSHSTFFFPNN